MTDPTEVVDSALREFTTRDSVPADPMIDAIAEVDPATAMLLADVASRFEENVTGLIRKDHKAPGILHARDAVNILLDLRNALVNPNENPTRKETVNA